MVKAWSHRGDSMNGESGITRMDLGLVGLDRDAIIIDDPDLVEEVFRRNYQAPEGGFDHGPMGKVTLDNPIQDMFNETMGNGLFTAADTDKYWGIAHRILIGPFSRQGMMGYVPLMNEQGDKLIQVLKKDMQEGKPLRLYKYTEVC